LLAGEARRIEVTADGRNRRGRVMTYEISGSLLSGGAGERRGAILMIREIAPAEQGEAPSAAST
jgi:hypothetical protein